VNTKKIWVLKLCLNGLENLKQNLKKMIESMNWIEYNWEKYIYKW
jgi:hypothetical protein